MIFNENLISEQVYYKYLSKVLGSDINTFGCVLSVAGNNSSYTDDISFVYCDPGTGELCSVPNIYVCMNEIEVPLKKVKGTYEFDGVTYIF